MTANEQEMLRLYNFLPDVDKDFALTFMKKLVLAWDPDFTKLTPVERADLDAAREDFRNGKAVSHADIDWD
jgi:hypothetical protein